MTGNVIYISSGTATTPIASTKSDTIDTLCEKIERASSTQQDWREFLAGRKEWSMSVDWLVTAVEDIQKLLFVGNTYTLNVVHRNGNTKTTLLTGSALCTRCEVKSQNNGLVTGSFSFSGSGPLAPPPST